MFQTVKEALERRAKALTDARALHATIKPDMGEGEVREIQEKVGALTAEVAAIDRWVEQRQRIDDLEARSSLGDARRPVGEDTETRGQGQGAGAAVSYRGAFNRFLATGGDLGALSAEERAALARGERRIAAGDDAGEERAQVTSSDAAGGHLVPEEAMQSLIMAMVPFAPMLEDGLALELVTTTGRTIPIPGVDDTANDATAQAAEAEAFGTGADVGFAKENLAAYLIKTGWLSASVEMDTDGAFGMEPLLDQLLGERLGRKANKWLTTGTGVNQPQGIVTAAAASAVVPAGVAAVTADEILRFVNSVSAQYRMSPRARLQMNDDTFGSITLLKNGQGNYLIQEAPDKAGVLQIGARRVPYSINPDMAGMGANNASMVYGDLSRFLVRKVSRPVIGVLRNSANFWPGFGIGGYWRLDSSILPASAGAIKKLVHPAS